LVEHFNTLLGNLDLLGYTWDLINDNVIIVAGSSAEGVALKYNYYICQNKRSFQAACFLAFYNNNQINHVFEILEAPKNDINLSANQEFEKYIQQAEPNYVASDLRKVFKLKFSQDIGPVFNDSIDKNRHPCPYTYGQPRYTTLSKLQVAKVTSQL
jgi:hypothetical protein